MKICTGTLFLTMIAIAAALTACIGAEEKPVETISGSGNVATENREVGDFTAVTLQGQGNVIIEQTGRESLRITADDNFLPYLETVVRGGTLFIRTTENVVFTRPTQLKFHITAAALDAVELAGAGSFAISDLDTDRWRVTLPGSGSITVSGQAREQSVDMDGAGSYHAENLASEKATVESSGAGTAVVQVSDILDVTINGLGNVEYIGDPQVTQEINGVGSVRRRP